MSRPQLAGSERPTNLVVELREAFHGLNALAMTRMTERGHSDIRPAHAAVFQFLDDTGTTVSTLAGARANHEAGHGGTRVSPRRSRLPDSSARSE